MFSQCLSESFQCMDSLFCVLWRNCPQTLTQLWVLWLLSLALLWTILCYPVFTSSSGTQIPYPTVLPRASSSASEAPLLWLLHVAWHQFASPFTLPMPSTHIHLPCLGLCLFSTPGTCSWSDAVLWNGTVWPLALGFLIQVSSHWPWPDLAVGHEMSNQLLLDLSMEEIYLWLPNSEFYILTIWPFQEMYYKLLVVSTSW